MTAPLGSAAVTAVVPAGSGQASDAANASRWPSVGLCIPTFRRPGGLRSLLAHVARLTYAGPVFVVVVENDPDAKAGLGVVAGMRDNFPFPLHVIVESRRGQTFAYNRGFAHICGQASRPHYVAVLDDDEYPEPTWLTELIATAQAYAADIAGGPVFPVFEDRDHWLARTGLFEPARFATGRVDIIYGAGNMLIRRDVLQHYLDEPFSAAFAFTGGSDLEFFTRCRADGRTFAWADEARVYETTPRARTTAMWMLKRHFRKGSERTRIERAYARNIGGRLMRWYKGFGLLAYGLTCLPIALCRGPRAVMMSLNSIAAGAGRLAAEVDVHYEEYRH